MIKALKIPSKQSIFIYLVVIYVVGIMGLLTPATIPLFIFLTPVNILLVAAVALAAHTNWSPRFILTLVIIYLGGFLLEWVGVTTGKIFGEYVYEGGLGFLVAGVPPVMGVNWFILVYSATLVAAGYTRNTWAIAAIGASLMCVYDVFLEPAAMRYHFWQWTENQVPWKNYVAWWLSAFVFIKFITRFYGVPAKNWLAEGIFWLQLLFFILLWGGNNLIQGGGS